MITRVLFFCSLIMSTTYSISHSYDIFDKYRNEDAVVLENHVYVVIMDYESAECITRSRILVNNKNGLKYCRGSVIESQFRSEKKMGATIFDLHGNSIKELDSDDIKEAEYSVNSFYSGTNVKWFEMNHNKFPFIIEIEVRYEIETLFLWPDWYPENDIPVDHATYELKIKNDIKFSYNKRGEIGECLYTTDGEIDSYKWELYGLKKELDEDFQSINQPVKYWLRFKPEKFMVGEYQGSNESWTQFGNWYRELIEERANLNAEIQHEIKTLIAGEKDKRKIVDRLFKHLQNKTHYIAIELGIGGWQPSFANDVYRNGYGDCKDLTMCMIGMLSEAKIPAFPALVRTQEKGAVIRDFPSNQFNHCIAFVPLDTDTIWLECTSPYIQYNEIPYSISGTHALVITDTDTDLILIPESKSSDNVEVTNFSGELLGDGSINFKLNNISTGNRKIELDHMISSGTNTEDKENIIKYISDGTANVKIEKYETDYINNNIQMSLEGTFNKHISTRGKRIFLNPNFFNRITDNNIPEEDYIERETDMSFRYSYCDIDSIEIKIPEKYRIESLPKSYLFSITDVNFKAEYRVSGDSIKYYRRFELINKEIPKSRYKEFKEFLIKVKKIDSRKIVLKKI